MSPANAYRGGAAKHAPADRMGRFRLPHAAPLRKENGSPDGSVPPASCGATADFASLNRTPIHNVAPDNLSPQLAGAKCAAAAANRFLPANNRAALA
jgi:hypothetical protein